MTRTSHIQVLVALCALAGCGDDKRRGLVGEGDAATEDVDDGGAERRDGSDIDEGDDAGLDETGCVCDDRRPVCEKPGVCVECTASALGACRGSTPFCADNRCVACLSDDDCRDQRAPTCNAGVCAPCTDDVQCGDGRICDVASGHCGECTGARRDACGDAGGDHICDVLALRCTTLTVGSAQACENCVSDDHCAAGLACVEQRFAGKVVGTYCMPSAAGGCVRPYTEKQTDLRTLEGATVSICVPKQASCPALVGGSGYGAPCGVDANGLPATTTSVSGDDRLCGLQGVDGAVCVRRDAPHDFRCTLSCAEGSSLNSNLCPAVSLAYPGETPTCLNSGSYPEGGGQVAAKTCSF